MLFANYTPVEGNIIIIIYSKLAVFAYAEFSFNLLKTEACVALFGFSNIFDILYLFYWLNIKPNMIQTYNFANHFVDSSIIISCFVQLQQLLLNALL